MNLHPWSTRFTDAVKSSWSLSSALNDPISALPSVSTTNCAIT